MRFTAPCVFLLRIQGTKMINRLDLLDGSFQVIKEGCETLKLDSMKSEGELYETTSVGNSDSTNHRPTKLYNLDVILAVGYRNHC